MNRAQYTIAASVQHCRRTSIASVVSGEDGGMAIDHMIPRKVSDWTISFGEVYHRNGWDKKCFCLSTDRLYLYWCTITCRVGGGGFLGEWVSSLSSPPGSACHAASGKCI